MVAEDWDDWQFCLWSTFALELLARAALAKISPILLAAPAKNDDPGKNALFGAGIIPPGSFKPKSLDISSVFNLLAAANIGLSAEQAKIGISHMNRRNAELHSGSSEMAAATNKTWLAEYFEVTEVLLQHLGKKIGDYLGPDSAKAAAEIVKAAKDQTAKAVLGDVAAHKAAWAGEANKPAKLAFAATWASRTEGHRAPCPSCGTTGLLKGDPSGPASKELKGDQITEKQPYLPATFECVACGLKIGGLAKLVVCDLGTPYTKTTKYSVLDEFGPVDDEPDYEPDFNDYDY